VIGLYQEPGWKTVTVLFLPETTDSLFLRLRPSHGQAGSYPKVRVADITGQSLPVLMASGMMDVFWGDLHMTHQGRSSKSGDSFYRPFRTA
jgi:hypothetical protein